MALPDGWMADGNQIESGQCYVHPVLRSADPGGSRYAMKRLKNPRRRERFRREVEVMTTLGEEHGVAVPQVIDADLDDERPWYVMPWYASGSLEAVVQRGGYRSDVLSGLSLAIELAETVEDLHKAGYAHRDLKPANVLIADDDALVLADFGLCLPADPHGTRLTAADEAVGSRLYIAPENEGGMNDELDQRPADIYAYGKILWTLLAGQSLPPREQILEPENSLARVCGEPALHALDGLLIALVNRDLRARPNVWPEVIEELRAVQRDLRGLPPASNPRAVGPGPLVAARRVASSPAVERSKQRHRQATDAVAWHLQFSREIYEVAQRADAALGELNRELGDALTVNSADGAPVLDEVADEWGLTLAPEVATAPLGGASGQGRSGLSFLIHSQRAIPEFPTMMIRLFITTDGTDLWMVRIPTATPPGSKERLADFLMDDLYVIAGEWPLGRRTTTDRAVSFVDETARRFVTLAERYVEIVAGQVDPLEPTAWEATPIEPVALAAADEGTRADTTPPHLQSFEIEPQTMALGAEGAQITCRARIVDDLAGVAGPLYGGSHCQAWFQSPSQQRVGADFQTHGRVSGDALDGVYEATIALSQHAERGIWRMESLYLVDDVGNDQTLAGSEVARQGFPTTFEIM